MSALSRQSTPLRIAASLAFTVLVHGQHAHAEVVAVGAETAQVTTFDISEYRVLGNTVLDATAIQNLLLPFLGSARTIDDVEKARAALEKQYHDAGYGTVFVDIPEQSTELGIVRLKVTEGRVGRVRVSGARYFANQQIRAGSPSLTPGVVPKLTEVQKELTVLNSASADRVIVPVLKAGDTPGTVDIDLKVDDHLPLHGSLEVNDRYTQDTSRYRVTGMLSYSNLFQKQHALSLQYQTAPQNTSDVEAWVGSYLWCFVDMPGTTFIVYAVDSKTDVASLGTLSVIGNGNIYGLRAIHALDGSANETGSVTFGVDYKDFLENIRLGDAEDEQLKTPIRYLNWSVAYSSDARRDTWLSTLELTANLGVRGLVNDNIQFSNKRYSEFADSASYFYLRGSWQNTVDFSENNQAFVSMQGQWAARPLLSNEQLAIGGVDTVRGYLESTQLGDYGALTRLEWRNAWPMKWMRKHNGNGYVLAFVDAGRVKVKSPLPAQQSQFDLASWGLGINGSAFKHLEFMVSGASVLKASARINKGDTRIHMSVKYSF